VEGWVGGWVDGGQALLIYHGDEVEYEQELVRQGVVEPHGEQDSGRQGAALLR
jgi:hypothetical protein